MANDNRTQHATLGCGTLILIALIVLLFSKPGMSELQQDVRSLCTEVGELKKAIDSQTEQMKKLQEKIDQLHPLKGEKRDDKE